MRYKAKVNPATGRLEWEGEEPPNKKGYPAISSAYSDTRPLESQAMGCHPNQVADFNEKIQKRGGNLRSGHYNEKGNFVTTSRQARNDELKARCMLDADAGYGDHAGSNP